MFQIKMEIVLVLLSLLPVLMARSTHFCPPTFVDCSCGNAEDSIVTIALNTSSVIDEATGMPRCVVDVDPLEVCESRKCFIIPNDNFESLFKKGRIISPSNSIDSDYEDFTYLSKSEGGLNSSNNEEYPVQYKYPRASRMTEGLLLRQRRQAGQWNRPCQVPELANAEVTCWKWPNYQTCRQQCIYGYGIPSRIGTTTSKHYKCRNSENQWHPTNMIDCKPYAHCRLVLTAPGELSCTEPGTGPAVCDVFCEEYDDRPAEKHQFVCAVEQKQVYVPPCTTMDKTVSIIRPPSIPVVPVVPVIMPKTV